MYKEGNLSVVRRARWSLALTTAEHETGRRSDLLWPTGRSRLAPLLRSIDHAVVAHMCVRVVSQLEVEADSILVRMSYVFPARITARPGARA